jgi:glycosyltransferase involved in cell wall biosynthesis
VNSVLHVGSIAGVPQELSAAQRRLGLISDVLSFEIDKFSFGADFNYPIKLDYSSARSIYLLNPLNLLRKMPVLLSFIGKYDLIHFHYSSGLPFGVDFPLWRYLKKKAVMHHHGSDIRKKGEPWFYKKFAQRIFVSTPDLLEWSPDAIWIPNPINIEFYSNYCVKAEQNNAKGGIDPVKILHASSRRSLGWKGTEYVLQAIKKLKSEGYLIDLIMVENMPHNKALEYYKQADIVVDQLLVGWYGMLAQECMALGKPVCVYLRKDLEAYIPSHPMLNTNIENIVDNLRLLIEDPCLRSDLGKSGRKFVERVHSSDKVARQLMDQYP